MAAREGRSVVSPETRWALERIAADRTRAGLSAETFDVRASRASLPPTDLPMPQGTEVEFVLAGGILLLLGQCAGNRSRPTHRLLPWGRLRHGGFPLSSVARGRAGPRGRCGRALRRVPAGAGAPLSRLDRGRLERAVVRPATGSAPTRHRRLDHGDRRGFGRGRDRARHAPQIPRRRRPAARCGLLLVRHAQCRRADLALSSGEPAQPRHHPPGGRVARRPRRSVAVARLGGPARASAASHPDRKRRLLRADSAMLAERATHQGSMSHSRPGRGCSTSGSGSHRSCRRRTTASPGWRRGSPRRPYRTRRSNNTQIVRTSWTPSIPSSTRAHRGGAHAGAPLPDLLAPDEVGASARGSGLRAGARRAAAWDIGHTEEAQDALRGMCSAPWARPACSRSPSPPNRADEDWPSVAPRPRSPSRNSLTFRTASRPSTTSIAFLPATPSSRPPRAAPALPRTPHRRRRGGLLRDDRTGGQHGSLRGRHGDLARGGR